MNHVLRITIGRPGDDDALHSFQYVGSRSRCRHGLAERYRRARAAGYEVARSPLHPMSGVIQSRRGSIVLMEILADPDGEHEPMIPEPIETIGAGIN